MQYEDWINKYSINLNKQQEEAVLNVNGSILLLAVPGSGKTTVIVSRVGYMIFCKNIAPENILTLTYSVAAANDMRERFNKIFGNELVEKLEFRTINSFCLDVIRCYERKRNTKKFNLITDKEKYKILSDIYKEVQKDFPTESIINDIISQIGYIKNMMLDDADVINIDYDDVDIHEIYKGYIEYNKINKVMDFDDQLIYAYKILKSFPEIRNMFLDKYKYINVDEAQDTSKIQHEIINLLVNENIFMVGDEDQSIYKFRGAYPEALLNFEKRYKNAKVLFMETNYRSTPEIVQSANIHIRKNKVRKEKKMIANMGSGNQIVKNELNELKEQYEYLLDLVIKQQENKTLAIIYRNNDSVIPIISLFKENSINFNIKGGDITFFSHKIVRDIKSYIKFIINPSDLEAFKEIYYKLGCNITKVMVEQVKNKLKYNNKSNILDVLLEVDIPKWQYDKISTIINQIKYIRNKSSRIVIECILNNLGYKDFLIKKEKDTINKLPAVYEQKLNILYYIAKDVNNINDYITRLEYTEKLCKNDNKVKSNITLTTIHSSKGLEFDKVILIDMNEGIIPSVEKDNTKSVKDVSINNDYEEDVRLFYVAVTRAKSQLEVLVTRKSFYGNIKESEFVNSMFKKEHIKPKIENTKPKKDITNSFLENITRKCLPKKDISVFSVGDIVKNLTFGIGTIVQIDGEIAYVEFKNKNIKRMIMYYLTKI